MLLCDWWSCRFFSVVAREDLAAVAVTVMVGVVQAEVGVVECCCRRQCGADDDGREAPFLICRGLQ